MFAPVALSLASLFAGAHAITPDNLVSASLTGALSALRYSGVGGSGSYNQVTNMIAGEWPSCTANPSCITAPKAVSGNLAPFDEDITFVMRGPMQLYNIAVYQPGNTTAATWKRVSSWTPNQQPDNMVFMANAGGGASGEWSICGGASQAYVGGDFSTAVATPNEQLYSGSLPSGKEVNIMTATTCQEGGCDGFFRGTANQGWASSKLAVFEFEMPDDPQSLPALWALNAQVVRAAQYGCNCRGMGGDGGCGELDIAETLTANSPQAITELYSFKGATGSGDGNFFPRPVGTKETIAVVLDVKTDAIAIVRLTDFDFTQAQLTRTIVDGLLGAPAMQVPFGTNKRRNERPHPLRRRH
ncbi:DUF2403 and DUF2401 domain-containing protein [Phanerochaete sordida]|uniref:glucan endo-1,3-beta-D-glucosidase n=1 Tax=Phanerochaete sordida TaxID=48140 RepID=A0A9P3LH95_9APHY|nr:DUF2403 and DUF2401 domain-containing protein [Phanerochaete sordida]